MKRTFTEKDILYFLLFSIVAIISMSPFFNVGFTTMDDLEYYTTRAKGLDSIINDARAYAHGAGRFYFLLTKYFYYIPYLIDNFYFTKIVQCSSLLLSYLVFAYFIWRLFRSKELSLVLLLFLTAFSPISFNYHMPFIAYPFYFAFSFTLCICAFLLFIKYTECGKLRYVYLGAVLFFITILFYETYLIFLGFLCLYILIRNIRKYGKQIFRNAVFYKEIIPFILSGVLFVAIYFAYREYISNTLDKTEFYNGSSFATNFSFSHFFTILGRCTKLALPTQVFWYQKGDMVFDTLLIGGHKNNLWYVLSHAPISSYINALIVSVLSCIIIAKSTISNKRIGLGLVVSLILAFASHTLIAVADKYHNEWYSWMKGYVTTYYSYFFILTSICLLFIFFAIISRKRKITSMVALSFFFCCCFASCVIVGYSNDNLSREWKRSQNRFFTLDEMIKQDFFSSIPERSIIYDEELHKSTQWGREVTKIHRHAMDDYIELKAKRHYYWAHSWEELEDLQIKHHDSEVYYMKASETIKNCEYMLAVSKIDNTCDSVFNRNDLKATASDVFYYSPTKDYVLLFKTNNDSSTLCNNEKMLRSQKGLNAINVINTNKNKKLTRVSLSSDNIDPTSFCISNMICQQCDTIICN